MPDWSYQTLFRPLLFRAPSIRARDITLGAMGALASLPGGGKVIELFGDTRPPVGVRQSAWEIEFPGPVGLGAGLDVHTVALPALARCGFGFLEVGPVTVAPQPEGKIARDARGETLRYTDPAANDGVDALVARLARATPLAIPLGIRLAYQPGRDPAQAAAECRTLIARLTDVADFFTLDLRAGGACEWRRDDWKTYLCAIAAANERTVACRPLLLCLPPDLPLNWTEELIAVGCRHGITGVVVGGGVADADGGRLMGAPTFAESVRRVRAIRDCWGDALTIIGSGGIREPADALEMLEAGATFVQLHSGFVFAGPGLPKRINDAVAATRPAPPPSTSAGTHMFPFGWPWFALLGVGILLAGIIAWVVAATRVILPYDEAFLGLSERQLAAINNRLPAFMTHDRITFAGAMIALGIMYAILALNAIRRGVAWARRAVIASASIGFLGFFLYIGFGYLDPLHAVSTALLFVVFLLALPIRMGRSAAAPATGLRNDRRWRAGLWGQLLFILIGFGFLVAGLAISIVGVTTLFVPSDLTFMHTTHDALGAVDPHLIPLLAHDRASFGGTLVSNGILWMLTAMWGFQRGARWLWWAFVAAGLPGFLTTIGVHLVVGYTDFEHLAPVYLALILYALALALSHSYLCAPAATRPSREKE